MDVGKSMVNDLLTKYRSGFDLKDKSVIHGKQLFE